MQEKYTGYVYLIGSRRFGWYKIGKAKSHEIRLEQLGILLPFKIEVFAIWGSDKHSDLERQAHRIHAKDRINGEWFRFSPQERPNVIRRISSWGSTLIFPTDAVPSISIRTNNIEQDRERPKSANKLERSAFVAVYLNEHGLPSNGDSLRRAHDQYSLMVKERKV